MDDVVNDFIQFKANVVSRKLQLKFKDKEQSVECIRFGCTYYGSDIVKSYTLCNSSPVPISYVAILEENGPGEEKVRFAAYYIYYETYYLRNLRTVTED